MRPVYSRILSLYHAEKRLLKSSDVTMNQSLKQSLYPFSESY